ARMEWYHIIGSTTMIAALLMSPRLQSFFSLRLFRFLGDISFCLYLLHAIVIGSLGCYTFLKLYQQIGYMPAVMVALMVTIVVCVIASYLMTKAVDDNGIRLSKYVYRRWFHEPEHEVPSKNEAELARVQPPVE